ncbi:MAG: hypothetical protein HRU15_04650 [Planctomycetes bacterium]|nr:hypothetical protein [Planctomycetota bacterium]
MALYNKNIEDLAGSIASMDDMDESEKQAILAMLNDTKMDAKTMQAMEKEDLMRKMKSLGAKLEEKTGDGENAISASALVESMAQREAMEAELAAIAQMNNRKSTLDFGDGSSVETVNIDLNATTSLKDVKIDEDSQKELEALQQRKLASKAKAKAEQEKLKALMANQDGNAGDEEEALYVDSDEAKAQALNAVQGGEGAEALQEMYRQQMNAEAKKQGMSPAMIKKLNAYSRNK